MKRSGMRYARLSACRGEIMGVAILGIVLCHLKECMAIHDMPPTLLAKLLQQGRSFVDVFMLLSGFGLYYSYNRNPDARRFWKKRILRLLPAYFIIAAPYWIWRDIIADGQGVGRFLYDLSLVSCVLEGVMRFWFVLAMLLFYALFPAIYRFAFSESRSAGRRTAIMIVLSVLGSQLIRLVLPEMHARLQILIDRMPAFILGAYLGKLSKENAKVAPGLVPGFVGLTVLLQALMLVDATEPIHEYITYYASTCLGIVLMLLVVAFMDIGEWTALRRLLRGLGSMTLEVYLFHSLLKNVFDYPPTLGKYLIVAVLMPLAFGGAAHAAIERLMKSRG